MKSLIETLYIFFKEQGFEVVKLDLKLTQRGQIEYATGELKSDGTPKSGRIDKEYRKQYVAKDWRFNGTELEVPPSGSRFVITRNPMN